MIVGMRDGVLDVLVTLTPTCGYGVGVHLGFGRLLEIPTFASDQKCPKDSSPRPPPRQPACKLLPAPTPGPTVAYSEKPHSQKSPTPRFEPVTSPYPASLQTTGLPPPANPVPKFPQKPKILTGYTFPPIKITSWEAQNPP